MIPLILELGHNSHLEFRSLANNRVDECSQVRMLVFELYFFLLRGLVVAPNILFEPFMRAVKLEILAILLHGARLELHEVARELVDDGLS